MFGTEEQFADLIGPDNMRLVEIWNSLPGVKPVTKFANRKMSTECIWEAVQMLGGTASAAKETANAEAQETPGGTIRSRCRAIRNDKTTRSKIGLHHTEHYICGTNRGKLLTGTCVVYARLLVRS